MSKLVMENRSPKEVVKMQTIIVINLKNVNRLVNDLLCDAVLHDGGGVELQQTLPGQAVDESQDCLLATLCTESVLLLVIVDHLLQPLGGKKQKQNMLRKSCRAKSVICDSLSTIKSD